MFNGFRGSDELLDVILLKALASEEIRVEIEYRDNQKNCKRDNMGEDVRGEYYVFHLSH